YHKSSTWPVIVALPWKGNGVLMKSSWPRIAVASVICFCFPLAVSSVAQTWSAAGPEVIRNGQTEGISPNGVIPNPTLGGVKVVLPVPGQSDQLLLGSTNGGIWRTTDLSNGAGPSWTNVTPTPTTTSHSIGAMAFNLLNSGEVY